MSTGLVINGNSAFPFGFDLSLRFDWGTSLTKVFYQSFTINVIYSTHCVFGPSYRYVELKRTIFNPEAVVKICYKRSVHTEHYRYIERDTRFMIRTENHLRNNPEPKECRRHRVDKNNSCVKSSFIFSLTYARWKLPGDIFTLFLAIEQQESVSREGETAWDFGANWNGKLLSLSFLSFPLQHR